MLGFVNPKKKTYRRALKPETILQAKIVKALQDLGYEVFRINSGRVKVNGGWSHGAKKGTPDLLTSVRGRAVFFEVKLPGEDPTPAQVIRHGELRGYGYRVYVVRGTEDLKDALTMAAAGL